MKQSIMEMNTQPKRAVIYCRVSSPGQDRDDTHGLTSQETRCRQFATQRGMDVVAVFPDTKSAGGDFMKRPGMVSLLAFLDDHPDEKFCVVFDDLKRFARDRDFHFRLRAALQQRGAVRECLNFKFEDSPEGEFIETIMAAQGQLEREQNARQVRQKMKARMDSGFWIHNSPVGYKYETIRGKGKVLVPNPPFDAIVKEALESYASGRFQTQAEVARFLNQFDDLPLTRDKNGQIRQQRVTDILKNPIYTGYICSERYDLNWIEGQHEGLISLETYQKIQDRRNGVAKAPNRKNIGEVFGLRGIVICDCCKVPLRSSVTRGNGGHYAYYLCQTKGCDHYGKSIAKDRLEGDVGELVKQLQPTKGLIELATIMFRDVWESRCKQAQDVIASGKKQLSLIDQQIETVLERIMDASNASVISRYEDKIAELEQNKRILSEKLRKQAEPQGSFEEKLEPVLRFLANPWKLWENGNNQLRRTIIKFAFADRIHYDRFKGARTAPKSFSFKALGMISEGKVRFGAPGQT